MRWVFYVLAGIAVVLGAAAAFAYAALPTDFVRDELAAQFQARTGRTLHVGGPVSISLYPETTVDLSGVTISPPTGMPGEATLSISALRLKAPLWPLLWHQLTIEGLVLDHPVIVLKTDADGRRSWDLRKDAETASILRGTATGGDAPPPLARGSTSTAAGLSPRRIAELRGIALHGVHVESGTIRLIDKRSNLNETLSDVSLDLDLDAIDGPATIQGAATWSGEHMALRGTAGPVSNIMAGDPALVDLAITGRLASAKVKATYSQLEQTPLGGHLELTAGSLRDLMRWLRQPMPGTSGFGPMTLAAQFGLSGQGFAVRNATLAIDGGVAKGDFSITRGKDRPVLRANLTLDRLDLNAYLSSSAANASLPAATTADGGAAPATKPATADAGWSDDPIDLSALQKVDADVTLALQALQWHAIKVGRTALKASLRDSVLKTRFSEIELYGGKGEGSLVLDGKQPAVKFESVFALHGIQVQPFLADSLSLGEVAGRGDLSFGLIGSGRSQHEIVKTLMGQGHIEIGDGAIVGFDVSKGIRNVQAGQFGSLQTRPTDQTAFSLLTASCTITNGILDNRDLTLSGPVLKVSGAGTASVPDRTLNYTAQPSLVDSADAQEAAGLTIPLHISGPWAKPSVVVDIKAVTKNPQAALDSLKKAVTKFGASKQGKALGDLIGGLLGKSGKAGDPGADQAPAQ